MTLAEENGHNAKIVRSTAWHHWLAAVILLLFAVSHFAALTVERPSQDSINTVFPFLSNWAMFFVAGVFELVTAVTCIRNRGRDRANLAILVFIIAMVWYRWALSYTGGAKTCQCLGIIGHLFHLSKTQEKLVPIIALTLLGIMILPWLLRYLRDCAFHFARKEGASGTLAVFMLASAIQQASAQQTVEVRGHYEGYHYNPVTGSLYTNYTRQVAFQFTGCGAAWSLYATNIAKTGDGLRTPWEAVVYDGTNTYTFMPDARGQDGKLYPIRTTISPSPVFIRDYDEWLDFDVIWLMYGLKPQLMPTNNDRTVEFPLPWYNARNSITAYGKEWKISPSEDGRFVAECKVLVNTNLTMSATEELRRTTINYPETLGGRNRLTEMLASRADGLPHGFVEATYKCVEWFNTNGFVIPKTSEQTRYSSTYSMEHPLFTARVRASELVIRNGTTNVVPAISKETLIVDYRYRRVNEERVSPFISYKLAAGDDWKGDHDPVLMKQADTALKNGRRFDFRASKHHSYLTWLLLVLVVVPVVALLKTKSEQKK